MFAVLPSVLMHVCVCGGGGSILGHNALRNVPREHDASQPASRLVKIVIEIFSILIACVLQLFGLLC